MAGTIGTQVLKRNHSLLFNMGIKLLALAFVLMSLLVLTLGEIALCPLMGGIPVP
jgi:hypothetical protein